MNENMHELIRHSIDDCLSGVDQRSSLESRVLERLHGRRKAPVKLSLAMAMALVMILLTATALAVGAIAGWFRVDQQQLGAMRSCVSDEEKLYLLTTEGLHIWQPGQEKPELTLSSGQFQKLGISTEGELCKNEDKVLLFHPETCSLWQLQNDQLHQTASFDSTLLTQKEMRVSSVASTGEWVFIHVYPHDAAKNEADVYRWQLSSGTVERMDISGVLELIPYKEGQLLVLQQTAESAQEPQVQLALMDAASGCISELLYTAPAQTIRNIMVHPKTNQIYAVKDGAPSLWVENSWLPMQGYALSIHTDSCAIVGDSFAAINFNDLQVIPFSPANSMPTLSIAGFMPLNNEDALFQQFHSGVAIQRKVSPSLKPADVYQAIAAGDTTDLFHLRLDGDLAAMFTNGTLAPLSNSQPLLLDAQGMLPAFRAGIFSGDELYAVPSMAFVSVWESEETTPSAFAELLPSQQSETGSSPIELYQYGESWTAEQYADYLLRTYIASCGTEKIDFRNPDFLETLQAIRNMVVSSPSPAEKTIITTDALVDLNGLTLVPPEQEKTRIYSMDGSISQNKSLPLWQVPAPVVEGSQPMVPAQLTVYVLNPNAANPEAAISFLEWLIANRTPGTEALLKPMTAKPMLNPAIEKEIQWIIEEQRSFEAEQGIDPDEEALKKRIDAIKAAPDSWAVEESCLTVYRTKIAPHISLTLHPLLTQKARAPGGVYEQMLQIVHTYVQGEITLEECIQQLEALIP